MPSLSNSDDDLNLELPFNIENNCDYLARHKIFSILHKLFSEYKSGESLKLDIRTPYYSNNS